MVRELALMSAVLVADLGGETVTSLHLAPGGELLVSENTGRASVRVVSPDGHVELLVDELRSAASVVGTRDTYVVADPADGPTGRVNRFTPTGTTVLRPGAPPANVRDLAAQGDALWAATPDSVGLLHERDGAWQWDAHAATNPTGVSERPGGGVYYTTHSPCHVYVHAGSPRVVAGSGACGTGPGSLDFPQDVEVTPDGGLVIAERSRVSRIAPDGTFSVLHGAAADGIEVTPDGDVLFSDGGRVYRHDGNFVPGAVTVPPPPPPDPVIQPPLPPAPALPATPRAKPATARLTRRTFAVRRGKRVRLTFTASHAGAYRVDVRRGGKRVKRLTGRAKPGRNTRSFKVTLRPGTYRLALTRGGTDAATLRVSA